MFAIVDIETTGGNSAYDRITEVCIILHDGLVITEKFSSLINPERSIPYHISRLTGITNEMVESAPKFWEIAKKIIELTENRVFVAHNVSFDYNFIQSEFRSLGYDFKREKLCTVQLSRKLIPGFKSYSLGRLCEQLSIEIENRHRAEGDALATAELFNLLMQKKLEHPKFKGSGLTELNTTKVDKIKIYILNKLPQTTGVYYFLNKDGEIIYIGKSNNMRQRAIAHFSNQKGRSNKLLWELMDVDFVETGSELVALLKESNEIKKHKPKFNKARKKEVFTHSVIWYPDALGIYNLEISEFTERGNKLMSFNSYSSARTFLEKLIDKYELCLKYCSLTSENSECFNHQIKKCRGICSGEEGSREYNSRFGSLLKEYLYPDLNFLLIDRGRIYDEKSFVLIRNGLFHGYGYLDSTETISSFSQISAFLIKSDYFPDCDALVRSWIKSKEKHVNLIPFTN